MSDTEQVLREKLQALRQQYAEVADELKHELSSLQESYIQLGQRAGALAGERDALCASLEEARQSIDSNEAELDTMKQEHDQIVHDLRTRLAAGVQAQQSLREELESLKNQYEEKLVQSAPLEDQIAGLQASVQKSLLREKKLLNERDTVVHKLAAADKTCAAAAEERRVLAERLNKLQEECEHSHKGYLAQIATLEERVLYIESERDEAREQVAELEAALFEHTSLQVEELKHALREARNTVNEIESVTVKSPQGNAAAQEAETRSPEEPNEEHSEEALMHAGNASTP